MFFSLPFCSSPSCVIFISSSTKLWWVRNIEGIRKRERWENKNKDKGIERDRRREYMVGEDGKVFSVRELEGLDKPLTPATDANVLANKPSYK